MQSTTTSGESIKAAGHLRGRPTLTAARWYAANGWRVVPASGKNPGSLLGRAWQLQATTNPETIREWWERWPSANVAVVPTGAQLVLDVDPRHGGDQALAELEQKHAPLPVTFEVETGSGGRHLYFHAAEPVQRVVFPARGLELRGGGAACVIGASSTHPDTQRPYRRVQPIAPIASLPDWLEELLHASSLRVERPPIRPYREPVQVRDRLLYERLSAYLRDPGPGGDVSAGGYRLACEALRGGLSIEQAAGLVQEHAESHGRERKAHRVSYYAATVAKAEQAIAGDRR